MARGRRKKASYSGAELIQEYQKIYKVAEAKKRARGEEMQRSQFTMQKELEITFNALKKNYEEKGESIVLNNNCSKKLLANKHTIWHKNKVEVLNSFLNYKVNQ